MIVCDRGEGGSKSEKKCDVIFEWPLSAAEAIMLSLCPIVPMPVSILAEASYGRVRSLTLQFL